MASFSEMVMGEMGMFCAPVMVCSLPRIILLELARLKHPKETDEQILLVSTYFIVKHNTRYIIVSIYEEKMTFTKPADSCCCRRLNFSCLKIPQKTDLV